MQSIDKLSGLPKELFDIENIVKSQKKIKVFIIRRKFTKVITILSGFDKSANLKQLCREMKQKFGVGGTVSNGNIEIQGNNKKRVEEYLKSKGYSIFDN